MNISLQIQTVYQGIFRIPYHYDKWIILYAFPKEKHVVQLKKSKSFVNVYSFILKDTWLKLNAVS